jgi:eukaryotic-like serine/threonine-protein kinase
LFELKWSPKGHGIFARYVQRGPQYVDGGQIGFLPKRGAEIEPITRDTNSYSTLTLSADGKNLATVQTKTTRKVYVLPGGGSQSAEVSPLSLQVRDIRYLNWTTDGNLLASEGAGLWRIGPDGKNPIRLVADSAAHLFMPSECRGSVVAFPWAFHGGTNSMNIWRVNSDGSGLLQLTSGKFDHNVVCSSDQKWVYYFDNVAWQIRRVLLDGSGKPEEVTGSADFQGFIDGQDMSISPDGKTLAYAVEVVDARTQQSTAEIALLNIESPGSPRLLEANPHISAGVRFTPDGKAVAYPIRNTGVDNLWVQPLNGSVGHQITNFNSEQIDSFHWSLDGKKLGIVRSESESDVVLLQETKP